MLFLQAISALEFCCSFAHTRRVPKYIIIYGVILAVSAFTLEWLEYQYLTRVFTTEIYIILIAAGFLALGVWAGRRLTPNEAAENFERNEPAIAALGVTKRELAVLENLAAGQSNKEIARSLELSPNTVKSHLARLFEKLKVQSRTQAIKKAQGLKIIP